MSGTEAHGAGAGANGSASPEPSWPLVYAMVLGFLALDVVLLRLLGWIHG